MAQLEGLAIARDDVTVALFCTDPRGMSDEFNGGWRACGLQIEVDKLATRPGALRGTPAGG